MATISKLQYISQGASPGQHLIHIKEVCQQGVDWVQLRLKEVPDETYLEMARVAGDICSTYGVKLIINDNVEVARQVGAHGVHLGKTDMDPQKAREILGPEAIIGGTANTLEDGLHLAKTSVNYIGLGPFRFTTTKKNLSPVLGLNGYREIIDRLRAQKIMLPVIAIGGILCSDLNKLLTTGIHGVAVSGALTNSDDVGGAVRSFQSEFLIEQT